MIIVFLCVNINSPCNIISAIGPGKVIWRFFYAGFMNVVGKRFLKKCCSLVYSSNCDGLGALNIHIH